MLLWAELGGTAPREGAARKAPHERGQCPRSGEEGTAVSGKRPPDL